MSRHEDVHVTSYFKIFGATIHSQKEKLKLCMFSTFIACLSEGWDLGGSNLAVGGYDEHAIAREPRGQT